MSPRLREFNNRVVGPEHYQGIDVWLNAKDTAGKVVRGFRGGIFFDWALVHVLVVDEPMRSYLLHSSWDFGYALTTLRPK
jgi:hypothetical protein